MLGEHGTRGWSKSGFPGRVHLPVRVPGVGLRAYLLKNPKRKNNNPCIALNKEEYVLSVFLGGFVSN